MLFTQWTSFFFDNFARFIAHFPKLTTIFPFLAVLLLKLVLNKEPVFVSAHFEQVLNLSVDPDLFFGHANGGTYLGSMRVIRVIRLLFTRRIC